MITVPGDAAVLERNQMQQYPNTMKLKDRLGEDKTSEDDQITKAIIDALTANDKVIEIRPATRPKGMGLTRFLLLGAGAIVFAYWVRNSQKPDDLIGSVKEKTVHRTHQAGETIEEGSAAVSNRIEEGSEQAGETIQEAGKTVAEQAEEAGEKLDETDSDARGSSRT